MENQGTVKADPDEQKPNVSSGVSSYSLIAGFDPSLKFNILKFAPSSNRQIDISQFVEPVKLNRKDPWAIRKKAEEEKKKLTESGTQEGNSTTKTEGDNDQKIKPESLSEQQKTSVQGSAAASSTSKPARDDSMIAPTPSSQPKLKAQPFKKKTKQVFIAADQAARMLKKEEYQSWLLEDGSSNGERWVGRYESAGATSGTSSNPTSAAVNNDASNYVLFRLDSTGNDFQVIPCHRFYRFTQRPNYDTLGPDEAEAAYEKMQKPTTKEDVGRWFMRRRGANPSGSQASSNNSTSLPIKNEDNQKGSSSSNGFFDHSKINFGAQSRVKNQVEIPNFVNGRRNKFTAVQGSNLNDDDEEDKKPTFGPDGDLDEVDYEAEFDDDEEGAGNLNDEAMEEDEVKELAEKMKREMLAAGKAGDDERNKEDVDEGKDSWFGERADLTKEGKAVKKLLMRKGEDNVYDSDDDVRNPYASEEDESDLEEVIPPLNPNPTGQTEGNQSGSRSGTPAPGSQNNHNQPVGSRNKATGSQSTLSRIENPLNRPPSRSGTPSHPGDGRTNAMGGPINRSRGSSPQIVPGSKGAHGGTVSPVVSPFLKASPVSSPVGLTTNGKRKQHPAGAMASKEKKINSGPGPSNHSTEASATVRSPPATDQTTNPVSIKDQIVQVLRNRPLTTKELIAQFWSRVKEERNRAEFGVQMKEVASLVDGRWILKDGFK